VKALILATVTFAALALYEFVLLIRANRLASEALKAAQECQRIAEESQALARGWEGVARRAVKPRPFQF
jgi:hypothetical protein